MVGLGGSNEAMPMPMPELGLKDTPSVATLYEVPESRPWFRSFQNEPVRRGASPPSKEPDTRG